MSSADIADPSSTLQAVVDAWKERNWDRILSLLTPDVEWYDLGMLHPPARGRDAVLAFAESVIGAFPDFDLKIEGPVCVAPDGSRCAVHRRITGTHAGVYSPPGFAPTGRRASFVGVDLIEFRGKQISRILSLFDVLDAAGQLTGVALRPPEGSFRERLLVLMQRTVAFFARHRSRGAAG